MSLPLNNTPRWVAHPERYWHIRKTAVRLIVALGIGSLLFLCLTHSLWLTDLARLLIVSEPPRSVDAILVLGGGSGEREQAGAQLYLEGYALRVITSGKTHLTPGEKRSFAEISAANVRELGVPEQAILQLADTDSTRDEAVDSLALAKSKGWRSLIVVSDPFHMRRSAWAFRKVYQGSGIALTFVSAPDSWFRLDRWWTRERELIAVTQEYEKLLLYLLNGWLF